MRQREKTSIKINIAIAIIVRTFLDKIRFFAKIKQTESGINIAKNNNRAQVFMVTSFLFTLNLNNLF